MPRLPYSTRRNAPETPPELLESRHPYITMSSSDSDAPVNTRKNVPSDKAITSALRAEVQNCYANDDEDNLTLKRIRAAVAKKLKLADDFFKNSDKWNGKSKEIVMEEVVSILPKLNKIHVEENGVLTRIGI